MREIEITKTKKYGHPAIWVGGGAYTNTCEGTWVLDASGRLKPAIFVKRSGHLSNSSHALVLLRKGDLICQFSGRRDEIGEDEISSPEAHRVVGFEEAPDGRLFALVEPVRLTWAQVPEQVMAALDTYHNRGVVEGSPAFHATDKKVRP